MRYHTFIVLGRIGMNERNTFESAMSDLMSYMRITPLAAVSGADACVISFCNGTKLYFRNGDDQFIDILAEAGYLEGHSSSSIFADLLALNRLASHLPLVMVGLDPATNNVTVSARIDIVKAEEGRLVTLVWEVLDRVFAVGRLLSPSKDIGPGLRRRLS